MFSKLKALVGLKNSWVIVFSIVQKMITQNFTSKHGSICKSKNPSYCFWVQDKNWHLGTWNLHFQAIPCVIEKFRLILFALYMKAITLISPEFSELSLWPNTQSFEIWSIPPRLEVLPLTQNYQTEQKDFDSKKPSRCLHLYSAQITSPQLSQVTLQPEFNLNNVTVFIHLFVVSCSTILEEI